MKNNLSIEKQVAIKSCLISEIISLKQRLEDTQSISLREITKNKINLLEEILEQDMGE